VDFLLESFPSGMPIKAVLLVGQANLERQIETVKKEKPSVVIGNSGRLLQLARMKKLRLDRTEAFVLDEGDRLCSDELLETTAELLSFLPKKGAQTISCSATLSAKSRERLLPLMAPGANIVETEGMSKGIEHWAFFSEDRKKIAALRSFLAAAKPKKALVFTARGAEAGNILSQLQHHHIAAGGIWGDLDKKARKAALDNFRKGNISVLVATDLACRGLDIPALTHVIALDVPRDPELYLHRSGRTGRQGKRGIMASIGNEDDLRNLQRIEKKLGMIVYPKELYGGRIVAPEAPA
jgi:superfamily II DNA/RNA helicase